MPKIADHFQRHGKKYAGGAAGVATAAALFIAQWEGFEPVAKHERIDPPGVITYCHGRTNYDDPNLKVGDKCTPEQAKEFLAADLSAKYLPPLRVCVHGFDAMPIWRQMAFLDAAYNLGDRTVCNSSMTRLHNAGDDRGACDAFLRYDLANGVVIRGLERRRTAERELCLRDQ